ncbi:DUF739 family protein [Streptococcus suis]
MAFDYSKLSGRIIEIFNSQQKFAKAMNLSERTISLKLNNQRFWKNNEIAKACSLLKIPDNEVGEYFFKHKVQDA